MYRKLLLTSFAANSDNLQAITEFVESVNVLCSVLWIVDTWDKVNPEPVSRCFARAGYMVNCFASDQQGNATEDFL
jgi:hypothetical protein